MKLHGAIKLGSTLVLLNNIDKYVPFLGSSISTLPGKLYAKIEKSYWTVLEQMASNCKKSKIWPYRPWKMTFRAIQPNLSFDMWFMSPQRSSMPKKKKSYWSVSSNVKGNEVNWNIWLTIYFSYKLWSWQARFRRYSPLRTQLPWFDL